MSKRLMVLAVVTAAILALTAGSAFANGYNTPMEATGTAFFQGPHGGYTTTTNKCADCHSTHYAEGSYMLLRASSRAAACDYCHGGGAGSTTNIMMDNDYRNVGDDVSNGVAIAQSTNGNGTGHTLGFTGHAPGDVKPAFASEDGLACFDCHSPHGNSKRILTTFSNPGRALGNSPFVLRPGSPGYVGNSVDGTINASGEWGVDPVYGNLKWFGNPDGAGGRLIYRPIWPSGRFLLLKDPHSVASEGVTDGVVAAVGTTATAGVNKYKIDWNEPLGPADGGYGGYQDNDNDAGFPFAPKTDGSTSSTQGPGVDGGFLAESEFCTDCHDGMSGASTQRAEVWKPAGVSGSAEGTYAAAYSHDAQPRH